MAIRYFCDRCYKEVGQSSLVLLRLGHDYSFNGKQWEICGDCAAELQDQFMKPTREQEKANA